MYWNAAGIANAPDYSFHASHNEWISDVRYEYLGAVLGMRGHALGVHVAASGREPRSGTGVRRTT